MGRIAYLSKRGNIWWFRRRHPAIQLNNHRNSAQPEQCLPDVSRVQAAGHIAVSLGTTSVREARLLCAVVSADFERAWAMVEAAMNGMDSGDDDLLDTMAMTITEGLRRHIRILRTGGASGLNALVREKAFNVIEAELRTALNVLPKPPALPANGGDEVVDAGWLEHHASFVPTDEDFLRHEMAEKETDGASFWDEMSTAEAEAFQQGFIDRYHLEYFALGTSQFRASLRDYLEACQRLGLDPIKETPELAASLSETLDLAREYGLLSQSPVAASNPATKAVATRKGPTPLFATFAKSYLDLRNQGYTLTTDDEAPHPATGAAFARTSLRNWQSSVRVFSEIVGDLPIADYTKEEIVEFNTLIQRLPANFGKSSKDTRSARQVIQDLDETEEHMISGLIEDLRASGRPPAEVEEAVAEARTKRISATTIKRHQTALKSIFEYAFSQRLIDSNPFKGRVLKDAEVKRRKKTEARIERTGWGESIYTLLGSEIYREPLSDLGEPLYWAPLIAMYAGLRLEEICQLRIRDFGREDSVLFVAVQNEIGSQSLKTNNSLRRIPLHRALIDVGLPQLVDLRREQGMSRLFPDMNRSKSKGTLSAIMSKRFGYYIRSRGIKDQGLDFHALRTEFLVRLTRAKVPDHVRKGLMGHEQTDVTHANYFRAGETISSLKEYIDRIDIAHAGVLSPFGQVAGPVGAKLRLVR